MRIVFFGTPEFAVEALKAVVQGGMHEVVLVVTQPDRPTGRKRALSPPPVKQFADSRGISVFQPETLDADARARIRATRPEVGVLVAYGARIPEELIAGFPKGIVNIHPSLLPRHRGATPIEGAIRAGDRESGVSLMLIDPELDHGPVIGARTIPLTGSETAVSLRAAMVPLMRDLLTREFPRFVKGDLTPVPQDHGRATFTRQIRDEDARIDWSAPVEEVERLVRAMHGGVVAWTKWGETRIRIHRARGAAGAGDGKTGILSVRDGMPAVSCSNGWLLLDELQLAGGKPMGGAAFLNGHPNLIGTVLV